jgi:hypothetical protein
MKTIESVENSKTEGIFDISQFLLSENDVIKNILIIENNLPEEDADLMVNGFVEIGSNRKKSKSQEEIDNLVSEADTKFKRKLIKDSIRESIKNISDTDTGSVISGKSVVRKRAKEVLLLIKEKISQFFRKVKELIVEIGSSVVSIISSIPGSSLMVSPPSFNIPGMITLLMQTTQLLSILSSKVSDLVEFFKYFKMLPLVLSPKDLNRVSKIINDSYISISKSFEPLKLSIDKFLNISISAIKKISRDPKAGKSITSRLRKLKYIEWISRKNKYVIRGIDNVNDDDQDDVRDILDNWNVIFLNNRRTAVQRKKMVDIDGREIDMESLLNSLDNIENLVNGIVINLPETNKNDDFIYDVQFGDGRTLFGITKDEVDGLKSIYDVIYSDNVKYSFL